MNKQKGLKIINLMLPVLVLWLLGTAILHDVLGENFEKVHPLAGMLLVICAGVHLSLNWGWVKTTYFKKK